MKTPQIIFRAEQSRAEQSRAEQSRAEQNKSAFLSFPKTVSYITFQAIDPCIFNAKGNRFLHCA